MGVFLQIIILIVVLASMVMVLLAIRQLSNFEGFDDEGETSSLKREVDDDGNVVSRNSIFHNLVDSEENIKKNKKSVRDSD